MAQLKAANSAFKSTFRSVKEKQQKSGYLQEALESGLRLFDIQGVQQFSRNKRSQKVSEEQKAYQTNIQRRNEALSNPTVEKTPVETQLDVSPTNEDAVEQIKSEAAGEEVAAPSNTQGNAKPLFDPAFEEKANFLAGTGSQAEKAGF